MTHVAQLAKIEKLIEDEKQKDADAYKRAWEDCKRDAEDVHGSDRRVRRVGAQRRNHPRAVVPTEGAGVVGHSLPVLLGDSTGTGIGEALSKVAQLAQEQRILWTPDVVAIAHLRLNIGPTLDCTSQAEAAKQSHTRARD